MYSYIKGLITAKENSTLTIEAGGIGYTVVPTASCYDAHKMGDITTLHTHLSITETAHTLYAFADSKERELFKLLTSVSGVGAKTAIAMLTISGSTLASAIVAGNVNMLASAKGVSRKTAEKVVIELQDKLLKSGVSVADHSVAHGKGAVSTTETEDALAALVNLGISRNAAIELVKSVADKNMKAEEIIVAALAKRGGAL